MIIRKATSSTEPEYTQLLQGKLLINIDVTSEEGEESTTFNYTQIVAEVDSDADKVVLQYRAEQAQTYLDDTDYLFTMDKYSTLSDERKAELETKREEARETIRNNTEDE